MSLQVKSTDLHILNMHTRFPFKYGIAALTAVPHLFVRVHMEIDGEQVTGISSDGLPPKWFTKNPETDFRDDLTDMFHVIETACGFAEQVGEAKSVFDLWQLIYVEQMSWSVEEEYPPLLWGFGLSLIERAMIDAFCRAKGVNFGDALRENLFGIQLGEMNDEIKKTQPKDWLPGRSLDEVIVRHTVGLADPLTDGEIPADEKVDDGLPQSLEACIKAYGLTHFKIKLCGDIEKDLPRLGGIAKLLKEHCGDDYAFTLDGNEQYKEMGAFQNDWEVISSEVGLSEMMSNMIFVEQPLHRDVALSGEAADALEGWGDRPAMIIDESDGGIATAADALDSGYVGTSHKNCKGVFKGIANACLIEKYRREHPEGGYVISGEDLANVGPVAMLQDMAVMSALGIGHVERNGHHYFKGLSMYSKEVQGAVLGAHGDLYAEHAGGFASLNVQGGKVKVGSVNAAGFGYGMGLDVCEYLPIDMWVYDSLGV